MDKILRLENNTPFYMISFFFWKIKNWPWVSHNSFTSSNCFALIACVVQSHSSHLKADLKSNWPCICLWSKYGSRFEFAKKLTNYSTSQTHTAVVEHFDTTSGGEWWILNVTHGHFSFAFLRFHIFSHTANGGFLCCWSIMRIVERVH